MDELQSFEFWGTEAPNQYQKYTGQVVKRATVSGPLFHSQTGHHHTKVLITFGGIIEM